MKRFIEGADRDQGTLFPERLDDFIAENNPVRVVEAFVEALDLGALGFAGINPHVTGRPAYHPSALLKLYIYGYLNRINSSRRLERETQRNVELMWLIQRLSPDFKTIADFRKDNGKAIRGVCREFVMLCRRLDLFTEAIVAIDGSKFKAVNNQGKNFTPAKMKRRLEQIDKSIARYLGQLDSADHEEPSIAAASSERLNEKIAALKEEMQRLKALEAEMNAAPDKQLSLTDPDARAITQGKGVVGYNVQTAVDAEHHLIVTHDVITTGSDRHQLATMAKQAHEAMGVEKLTAVADRGYYTSDEILAREQAGITPVLPRPQTGDKRLKGLFGRDRFHYQPDSNAYRCPAGESLIWRFRSIEGGRTLDTYWSSACPRCPIKAQCTQGVQRRIKRWEHEAVLDAMQARLDAQPETMRVRRQTVEHPFGTLKAWMGATHFLTRTLENLAEPFSGAVAQGATGVYYEIRWIMKRLGKC